MLRTATVCFALSALPAVAAPSVVADIAPVQALVARVMAGVGDAPTAIVPPGADPHALALKPSQARALQNADVVFWIGEELSPWLEGPLETLAGNAVHVALLDAEATVKLEPREGLGGHDHDEHGEEHADEGHEDHDQGEEHAEDKHDDHDHGEEHAEDKHDDHDHGEEHAEDKHDDHGHGEEHAEDKHDDHGDEHAGHDHHDHDGLDPHAWLSPENGAIWLGLIADVLSDADPDNADAYRANADAGIAEIEATEAEIATLLTGLADVPYGVTHDAFQYFEARFDLAPVAAISGIDAVAPGPARVAAVQDAMQDAGVSCLFEEAAEVDPLSATVLEGTDAKVIALDQFGDGSSYVGMLKGLAMGYASCVE